MTDEFQILESIVSGGESTDLIRNLEARIATLEVLLEDALERIDDGGL